MAEERVTQEYVEVLSVAGTENRVTQEYVEVFSSPATEIRVVAEYIEVFSSDAVITIAPPTLPEDDLPPQPGPDPAEVLAEQFRFPYALPADAPGP